MSDNKDSQKGKSDPFSQLTDMESTVRIDFGANQNMFSTSKEPEPDEFEQTLDGLTDIDDILKNDEVADHSDEPTVSFSTDEIDFDELDAGINALSEDFPEDEKAEDEKLDDLDALLEEGDELDSAFDNRTVTLDTFDSEEEPAVSAATDNAFDDWPLLSNEDGDDEAPIAEPPLDDSGEFDLSDMAADSEETNSEDVSPVIELTEEMLDEDKEESPAGVVSDEMGRLRQKADDTTESMDEDPEEEKEDSPKGSLDSIAETPGLTTTETNILAGATSAIHEIAEEEKKRHGAESIRKPAMQSPDLPVKAKSSSSSLPAMLALLGVAAGGFGAWMAWDAGNRVADLESQIRNLQAAKANSANRQSIADIQQRLTKVERRLTGTPTLEAASTLGEATAESTDTTPAETEVTAAQTMTVASDDKPAAKAITPATQMASSQGDWVVNLSSHVKESAAAQEKARLINMGLNAEVHSATIKDKVWYRVQIIGFATKDEAKKQLRDIQQRSGIQGAWVGKK